MSDTSEHNSDTVNTTPVNSSIRQISVGLTGVVFTRFYRFYCSIITIHLTSVCGLMTSGVPPMVDNIYGPGPDDTCFFPSSTRLYKTHVCSEAM